MTSQMTKLTTCALFAVLGAAALSAQGATDGTGVATDKAATDPQNPQLPPVAWDMGLRSAFHWGDFNGDVFLDAFVVASDGSCRLLQNHGDGTFEDSTQSVGLEAAGRVRFGIWGDWSGDGLGDLLLVDHLGSASLWLNHSGLIFEEHMAVGSPDAFVTGAEWIDYDQDGSLDLYLLTSGGHELYHNDGDSSYASVFIPPRLVLDSFIGGGISDLSAGLLWREMVSQLPDVQIQTILDGTDFLGDVLGEAYLGQGRTGLRGRGFSRNPGGTGSSAASSKDALSPTAPLATCASALQEEISGNCIKASTNPTIGKLYPLSPEFFVKVDDHATGDVRATIASSGTADLTWTAFEIRDVAGTFLGAFSVENDEKDTIKLWNKDTIFMTAKGHNLTLGSGPQSTIDYAGSLIDARNASALFDKVGIGTMSPGVLLDVAGGDIRTEGTFISTNADGQPPLEVVSSTKVANLNADLLDGYDAAVFSQFGSEVDESEIADDAVTANKIAAGAVGASEIAANAVNGNEIASNAVDSDEIATGAVGSSEIATGAVGNAKLASNSVSSDKIIDGAVGAAEIASDSVGSAEIAAGAVGASEIAANAVNGSEIAPNAVGSSEIASGAVGSSELASSIVVDVDIRANDDITAGDTLTAEDNLVVGGNATISDYLSVSFLNRFDETTSGSGLGMFFGQSGHYNAFISHLNGYANNGWMGVQDSSSTDQAGMFVNSIGQGVVWGDIKTFVADNPNDPNTRLWYACIEGPEAAAYTRGTAMLVGGQAIIQLPDHFRAVAQEEGMTVHLTPLSAQSLGLAVTNKSFEGIEMRELLSGSGTYAFDWEVKAVRSAFPEWQVVRPASYAAAAQAIARAPEED